MHDGGTDGFGSPIGDGGVAVADRADTSSACSVTNVATGETFFVEHGQALLDAGLTAGADLAFGCRVAVCGTCAVEIVSGLENTDMARPIEVESLRRHDLGLAVRLACQLRIHGPVRIRPA